MTPNAGKDVEQLEILYNVDRNVKWYTILEKILLIFFKKKRT